MRNVLLVAEFRTVHNDASTVSACGEEVFAVLSDTHAVTSWEFSCWKITQYALPHSKLTIE